MEEQLPTMRYQFPLWCHSELRPTDKTELEATEESILSSDKEDVHLLLFI